MMPMPGGQNIRLWHAWIHLWYMVPLLVVADLVIQSFFHVLMPGTIMELSLLIMNSALYFFYHLLFTQLMVRSWRLAVPIVGIAFMAEQTASIVAYGIGWVEAPILLRLLSNLVGRSIQTESWHSLRFDAQRFSRGYGGFGLPFYGGFGGYGLPFLAGTADSATHGIRRQALVTTEPV